MVRAQPLRTPLHLDPGRIAAMAAAIALHMAALLLLLMPMAAPQLARVVEQTERWQVPLEKVIPPPLPPEPVQPAIPRTSIEQKTRVLPPVTPAVSETATVIEQGTLPSAESTEVAGPETGPIDTSPMVGSQLRYVVAPPPTYPRAEQRSGVQGTVTLRVLVDIDGTPLEVVVENSSGNRNLDREARQHVLKHWRFQPAVRDGVAVQAYGLVPITFTLQ